MESRTELHELIDRLPDHELLPARRFLEYLARGATLEQTLAHAPDDDEPWTEAEEQVFQRSWDEMQEGKLIPMDRVCEHLGPP